MDSFRLRPIAEPDIDAIVTAAGGTRAHPEIGRTQHGADYRLFESVVELKILDDDGFFKPERQAKLAGMFGANEPDRPVVVLDPERLPASDRRAYVNIVEGPIKGAVRSAKDQLIQSRLEHADATASVLFIVNNGYTALNNDQLCELVANRARTYQAIDGVLVGGHYLFSDGFDTFLLCPLTYVPINLAVDFTSQARLRDAWNAYAETVATAMIREAPGQAHTKGPVIDTHFTLDGVTYVKPAPPMGAASKFYGPKRPRRNSTGVETSPPVALTFPDISRSESPLFAESLSDPWALGDTFEAWVRQRDDAASAGGLLRPFAPMAVTFGEWGAWRRKRRKSRSVRSLRAYANALFQDEIERRFATVQERTNSSIVPFQYVLALTEEIGQDKANDVSHIAVVRERPHGKPVIRPLAQNLRIFHEYAVTLASAYAVVHGVELVRWRKDLKYGWT